MNNYLNTLNPRQREAVETVKGPGRQPAGVRRRRIRQDESPDLPHRIHA